MNIDKTANILNTKDGKDKTSDPTFHPQPYPLWTVVVDGDGVYRSVLVIGWISCARTGFRFNHEITEDNFILIAVVSFGRMIEVIGNGQVFYATEDEAEERAQELESIVRKVLP